MDSFLNKAVIFNRIKCTVVAEMALALMLYRIILILQTFRSRAHWTILRLLLWCQAFFFSSHLNSPEFWPMGLIY